jgi:hypothetical protein
VVQRHFIYRLAARQAENVSELRPLMIGNDANNDTKRSDDHQ